MQEKNICKFIPYYNDSHSLHTINYVLETNSDNFAKEHLQSVYQMCYVNKGTAYINTETGISKLIKGDIFFTFPSNSFSFTQYSDFQYMYISFIGTKGNKILEKLNINRNCFIFQGYESVEFFWQKGISFSGGLTDLIAESVLLYTFSVLSQKLLTESNDLQKETKAGNAIKKYIDDNFFDPDLSAYKISSNLKYNKKYISYIFKKQIGIGIIEYLNMLRIQHACSMMEQGFQSVSDISFMCGFSDAQYFSKVFKKRMGLSPREYIKTVALQKIL